MSYHRRPQTQQERRLTGKREFLRIDDYQIKIRPRRNSANLPNAWDDLQQKYLGSSHMEKAPSDSVQSQGD
jgi:hypothetical protein